MSAPYAAGATIPTEPAPLGARPPGAQPPVEVGAEPRLERFLSELKRMSSPERVRASRYSFSRWERSVWAARYPEEVPLVNGEFEWIALRLA